MISNFINFSFSSHHSSYSEKVTLKDEGEKGDNLFPVSEEPRGSSTSSALHPIVDEIEAFVKNVFNEESNTLQSTNKITQVDRLIKSSPQKLPFTNLHNQTEALIQEAIELTKSHFPVFFVAINDETSWKDWTINEINQFIWLMIVHKRNWECVSHYLERFRSEEECYQQWQSILLKCHLNQSSKGNFTWTISVEKILLILVLNIKKSSCQIDWNLIAKEFSQLIEIQIAPSELCLRWHLYLEMIAEGYIKPSVSLSWTKEEESLLLKLVRQPGQSWQQIGKKLGRFPLQVKEYYEQLVTEEFKK